MRVQLLPGQPILAASLNGRAPVLHAEDHSSILWVATKFWLCSSTDKECLALTQGDVEFESHRSYQVLAL